MSNELFVTFLQKLKMQSKNALKNSLMLCLFNVEFNLKFRLKINSNFFQPGQYRFSISLLLCPRLAWLREKCGESLN